MLPTASIAASVHLDLIRPITPPMCRAAQ